MFKTQTKDIPSRIENKVKRSKQVAFMQEFEQI